MTGNHFSLNFHRDLQSIIHQSDFDQVRGVIIGRSQKNTDMTIEKIKKIVKSKKELDNIPVVANMNFGLTYPMFTFPIGGRVKLDASSNYCKLEIINH